MFLFLVLHVCFKQVFFIQCPNLLRLPPQYHGLGSLQQKLVGSLQQKLVCSQSGG